MEALIYFLLIASLFATMLQFGCSTRSKIPSPPDNAILPKAEPFLPVMRSLLGEDAASCGDSSNQDVLIRSKLSTGERK
jgi:hypothetical protein